MSTTKAPNRWSIAIAGVVMQIALGGVYAWSIFRTPLVHRLHASIPQISLTFTIAISSYLLDATRPNRLWFHQFCERNRLHLNGLLGQPVEEFSS